MFPLRRTLIAVTGLLATLTTTVLLASAASAQVLPPDLPYRRSTPTPAPVSGGFPVWAVVLTVVVTFALILGGLAFNVRLRLALPRPADA